jgi:hypothetical protein
MSDPLYRLFEQHLFNAIVEEETADEFLKRVVSDYLDRLTSNGIIPREHLMAIENDLRDEVLEMLRKKTYGHYSLSDFRKSVVTNSGQNGPSPQAAVAAKKTRQSKVRRES